MKLIRIEIQNFMPFKSTNIDFVDKGVTGILGYQKSFDRSNRAGKSSFVEAIAYGLYGFSRAKKVEELFHAGSKEMSVFLKFKVNDEIYTLRRKRNKSGTFLEFKGLEGSSIRETQDKIEELVGLNQQQFLTTTFFGQEDINRFMYLNPAEKKIFMNDVIGSSRWQGALEHTQKKMERLNKKTDKLEWRVKESSNLNEDILSKLDLLKYHEDRLAIFIKQKKDTEKRIKRHGKKMEELISKSEILKVLRHDLHELRERVGVDKRRKKVLKNLLKKSEVANDENIKTLKHKLQKVLVKVSKYQIELSREKDQFDAFLISGPAIVESHECPILKEYCSRLKKAKHLFKDFEKQKEIMKERIRIVDFKYREVVRRKKKLEEKILELEELLTKRYEAETQTTEVRKNLKRLKKDIDLKQSKVEELRHFSNQEFHLKRRQEKFLKELIDCEENISRTKIAKAETSKELELLKRQQVKKMKAKRQLKIISLKLGDYQFLQYAFGKNGISSLELENLYSTVEDEINFILSSLSLNLRCRFVAERELTSWEKHCPVCGQEFSGSSKCISCGTKRQKARRDELNLQILEGSEERAFHLDSGGGKLLISFALRLALARLIFRRKHIQSSFLILDEVFGVLDAHNRERLLELILRNLPSLGFSQIFVISHTDIKDILDNVLIVKKIKNFSEVSWHQN